MTEETQAAHEQLAAAFDRSTDPLAAYEETFERLGVDPFDLFATEVLPTKNITPKTRAGYNRLFDQWRAHMEELGRHPACPSEHHCRAFINREREERGNHPDTVREKLRKLNEVYSYWQAVPSFPHSTEYNPIEIVRQTVSLESPTQKPLPQIPLPELRGYLNDLPRLRDLAIVLLQLKLGLRATEVCNLTIGELHLADAELQRHYPSLGGHWVLENRPNAVYIPHDRYGNKSGRPRVLPVDEEVADVLVRYLLIRQQVDQPWVFLSDKGNQMNKQRVTQIWRDLFHPEYAETEHHRSVLSHYGRHRFTTYWRVQEDLPRPLVKYLRGDRPDSEGITERDGIDEYIHTYYEDIESVFRQEIYRLR